MTKSVKKLKHMSGLLKFPENWETWAQHLYKKGETYKKFMHTKQ